MVFTEFYLSKKRRGIVQLIRILYNLTFHNFGVTAILGSRAVWAYKSSEYKGFRRLGTKRRYLKIPNSSRKK